MNRLIPFVEDISSYFGNLNHPIHGIDHYGLTLIPPKSVKQLIEIIRTHLEEITNISPPDIILLEISKEEMITDLEVLLTLLSKAENEKKYVICFGI